MINIDIEDMKRLESRLKRVRSKSIPFASRFALNEAAIKGRSGAIAEVKQTMVLKNRWTERSIQFEKTRELRINSQITRVGSVQEYMKDQEFGGVERKQGKEGVPIPTAFAAGMAEDAKPITRPVRPSLRLSRINIQNTRRTRGHSDNSALIHAAAQSGRKDLFLDYGRRKGIFRVIGGKRNPRIKMLWDLSRQSVRIPPNPWLKPAINKVIPEMPAIYFRALQFQLDRVKR